MTFFVSDIGARTLDPYTLLHGADPLSQRALAQGDPVYDLHFRSQTFSSVPGAGNRHDPEPVLLRRPELYKYRALCDAS